MKLKRTRSFVCLCISTALCAPSLSYANNIELPDIGTVAGSTLTIDQELIYGDAYMRMLRSSKPIVNDPVINEYIDTLGHKLVANADDVKTPFTFFMIQIAISTHSPFSVATSRFTLACFFTHSQKVNWLPLLLTKLPT